MECCTRNPVKTSRRPSSMDTGIWTMISRLGYRRIFHKPSFKLSFCAAKSNRAACASHGFNSCSRDTVFIPAPDFRRANFQSIDIHDGSLQAHQSTHAYSPQINTQNLTTETRRHRERASREANANELTRI